MRNFSNNLIDLRDGINLKIRDNKILIISFSLLFLIGLFIGIFIRKSATINIYYIEYTENYYYGIFCQSQSVFSILFSRIINNLLFFSIIILLSLSIYLIPVHFIIIFYRGFILGVVCVIIFTTYSINGIFLTILVVVPQNIITTFFLIISIITGIGQAKIIKRQHCYFNFKTFILEIFILFLLSLLGALLELVVISFILRPLNFLF